MVRGAGVCANYMAIRFSFYPSDKAFCPPNLFGNFLLEKAARPPRPRASPRRLFRVRDDYRFAYEVVVHGFGDLNIDHFAFGDT